MTLFGFLVVANMIGPPVFQEEKSFFKMVPVERDQWEEIETFSALFPDFTEKEFNVIRKLKSVQKSCGDVCNTWQRGTPGKVQRK